MILHLDVNYLVSSDANLNHFITRAIDDLGHGRMSMDDIFRLDFQNQFSQRYFYQLQIVCQNLKKHIKIAQLMYKINCIVMSISLGSVNYSISQISGKRHKNKNNTNNSIY